MKQRPVNHHMRVRSTRLKNFGKDLGLIILRLGLQMGWLKDSMEKQSLCKDELTVIKILVTTA